MDRSWVHGRLFSTEHIDGVRQFMSFIQGKFSESVEILCPCARCLNQKYLCQSLVKKHNLMNGMDNYTRWIHHGESFNVNVVEHPTDVHDNADLAGSSHGGNVREVDSADHAGFSHGENVREDYSADHLEGLLGDLHAATEEEARQDEENEDGDAKPHDKVSFLKIVMKEAKCQFYPGCTKFSMFVFVVKLLHMKSLYRISNSAFSATLKLLAEAFPEQNILPKSYNEASWI